MPAVASYIPAQDAKLNLWLLNFASLTTATPAAFGLSVGDAATIASQVASWTAAYTPVTSPSTKTAQAVSAKNTARVSVVAQLRTWAQAIANNPGVSSDNKIALGLNPKTSTPSPITPPASNPVLTVQGAGNLSLIVRYRDSASSVSVKAKPYGVKQCQIFFATSATPIVTPVASGGVVLATKSPITIQFDASDGGKQCYLWGRWVTQRGGYSPWSPITNFTVPVGG